MNLINNQQRLLEYIKDNLVGESNISIRGLARLCGVEDTSIIRDADFGSQKLAQKLAASGFDAKSLAQNGFPPQAAWIVINYFAINAKAKAVGAKELYHRFLNNPYPNYFEVPSTKGKACDCLYIIHSEDAHCVKIGISNNPVKRLANLQTGFPYELKIIKTFRTKSARNLERNLHQALDIFQLHGEWFSDDCLSILNLAA